MNNRKQKRISAEGGSRTHTPVRTTDFEDDAPRGRTRSTGETLAQLAHVGLTQAEARAMGGPNLTAPEIPGAQSGSWSRSWVCGSVRVVEDVTGGVGS